MKKILNFFRKFARSVADGQSKGAQKTMLEELFNDFYLKRHEVYKMNFIRGIFFGLGSAIGGTIVIALIIWLLSVFVDFPVVGGLLKDAKNSLDTTQQN